jgi:hypothetical protein
MDHQVHAPTDAMAAEKAKVEERKMVIEQVLKFATEIFEIEDEREVREAMISLGNVREEDRWAVHTKMALDGV